MRKIGNSGYSPTNKEVREYRGKMTQEACAAIMYTTARRWRSYESGESRMHPAIWEYLLLKREINYVIAVHETTGCNYDDLLSFIRSVQAVQKRLCVQKL